MFYNILLQLDFGTARVQSVDKTKKCEAYGVMVKWIVSYFILMVEKSTKFCLVVKGTIHCFFLKASSTTVLLL